MKNYLLVVKLLFKNMLKVNGKDKNRSLGVIVAIALVGVIFAGAGVLASVFMGGTFVALDLVPEFITMLLLAGSIMVVIFGIASTISYLYFSKDSEFFLSLPIKSSTVFSAKFTVVYLLELLMILVLILPALIAFAVIASLSPAFYFIILIGILLAPSVPLVLAIIIAIPIMYILSFVKNKGAVGSIFGILIFAGLMTVYFIFVMKMNSSQAQEINLEEQLEKYRNSFITMSNILYPFYAIARASTLTQTFGLSVGVSVLINLLIFLASIGAIVFFAIFISSYIYKKGVATQLETKQSASTGKEEYKSSSTLKTLMKKDFKTVLRTGAFAFQGLSGVILAPILAIVMSILLKGDIMNSLDGTETEQTKKILDAIILVITLGVSLMISISTNVLATSAFSRDGKFFYYTKMLPVSYKTQIQAKHYNSVIISSIGAVLASILVFVVNFNAIGLVLTLLSIVPLIYGCSALFMMLDLNKPKLQWNHPNEVMKNSGNIMLSVFGSMLALIVIFVLMAMIKIFTANNILGDVLCYGFLFVISACTALVGHKLLYTKGEKLLSEIISI